MRNDLVVWYNSYDLCSGEVKLQRSYNGQLKRAVYTVAFSRSTGPWTIIRQLQAVRFAETQTLSKDCKGVIMNHCIIGTTKSL